jgi:O-antigen/teichoic acid export membrane protein
MVLADPFLSAWVGDRFAHASDIAVLLIGAGLAEIVMWPAASLLQGTNGHRPLAAFSGASALLNLGLSIALVGPMGVNGVALGTLVATGLEAIVVVPFAMRRHMVTVRVMVRDALAPGVLPAVPALVTLVALREAMSPSSFATILVVSLAGGIVYAACYLAFSASWAERSVLRRLAVGVVASRR